MDKISTFIIAKSLGLYINLLSYIAPKKSVSVAYKLFSQPRKGKLKLNNLPKNLQKTQHNTYTLNDNIIQTYTWQGNNEFIFLIHGWESNSSRWKKFLKQLQSTGKTIIAIDAPAHGLSNGKEFTVIKYAEFINFIAQKFPPSILIGHSIGGKACAYFLANYTNKIEKMILLGSPSDLKVIFNNYISMLGLNKKVFLQLKNHMNHKFNVNIDDFSVVNFLKNAQVKGIIAHDSDDKVVLIDEAKKIANSWKTAYSIETKGLGHSLHDQYLYKTIIDFIQEK